MKYDYKCDIWACGVMLYIMTIGEPPFNGKTSKEIISAVKKGKYDTKVLDMLSKEGKDLITKLLSFDPEDRPTAAEALEHTFIKNNAPNALLDIKNSQNVLKSIKAFTSNNKLEDATLSYIINFLVDKKELDSLKKTFLQFDANHDGFLSLEEIVSGYSAVYGIARAEEAKLLFKTIDTDSSNRISYDGMILTRVHSRFI